MKLAIVALLLTACAGPIESMAWQVDCARDTPRTLYERFRYEDAYNHPNCEQTEFYIECAEYVVVWHRYERAKAEYRAKCERPA